MTMEPVLTAEELQLLREVDTPTVCNVIEMFEVRAKNVGYSDRRLQCCFPDLKPMVGYAVTATCRTAGPPLTGAETYGKMPMQIDSFAKVPPPPVVVFQDLDDPPAGATFGELMCATYKSFGAAGLITNGPGRDIDAVKRHQFPCFTTGSVPHRGYFHIVDLDVPVNVCNMTIYPGDLLHGDCNGVTHIPRAIASQVARLVKPYIEAENEILKCVTASKRPTSAELNAARARCRDGIAALKASLKKH
jgi:regulator of RNase E activity RraA